MNNLPKKAVFLGVVALLSFVFLFLYLNDAVRRSRATADTVNINFTPNSGSSNLTRGETFIFIQTHEVTQKVSGFDITVNSGGNLRITDIEAPTFPGISGVNSSQIVRQISPTSSRVSYIFQNPDAQLPNVVSMKVVFSGVAVGSGTLAIASQEVTGTTNKIKFDVAPLQGASYTFISPPSPIPTRVPTAIPTNAPTAFPTSPPVPPAPTNLVATAGNGTSSITLTWNAVPGATSYSMRRSLTAGGPYISGRIGITANTFTDTGLTHGQRYYYTVAAVNSYGTGPQSNEASAQAISAPTLTPTRIPSATPTPPPVPSAPSGLVAQTIYDASSISLTWNSVQSALSYNIRRSTTAGGPYISIKSAHTTPYYTDTGLTHGQRYYYTVTAVNSFGTSAPSNESSAQAVGAPTLTPTRIPTLTPTRAPTSTPVPCPKARGDANCDYRIDLIDYEIWRKEFTGEITTITKQADFNASAKVDLVDYEIWRKNFFGSTMQ